MVLDAPSRRSGVAPGVLVDALDLALPAAAAADAMFDLRGDSELSVSVPKKRAHLAIVGIQVFG